MLKTLLTPFAGLPLRWLHSLGALLGWLVYYASPRYAARLRENLEKSGVCNDAENCRSLLHQAIAEAGKGAIELLPIWLRPEREVLRLVRRCHGWEHVEAALKRGKGIIFLTPHLGCFEITSLNYAAYHPVTVLYRPPKLRWLQPLLEAGRQRGLVTLAPTDMRGVKALLKALKRGEAVGILPDQTPGNGEGVWAEFFGRSAYTMTLAARLARSTGAAVILIYAERLPRGEGFDLWQEPLPDGLPEQPEEAARFLNAAIESLIRRQPAQYLWSYNRYKIPRGQLSGDRL
ncbi:MAG: lysophospholipid acyltransferase family protein [Sulfuricellaceae bacterium]